MPALGEQVEEDLSARMRFDDGVVERHAQAGPAGQREIAIDNLWITWRRCFYELLREIAGLLNYCILRGRVARPRGSPQACARLCTNRWRTP
jgi:hypothetical protein